MKEFSSDVISKMDINGDGTRKNYVYGLIDVGHFIWTDINLGVSISAYCL